MGIDMMKKSISSNIVIPYQAHEYMMVYILLVKNENVLEDYFKNIKRIIQYCDLVKSS